jgi:hypothetical protein
MAFQPRGKLAGRNILGWIRRGGRAIPITEALVRKMQKKSGGSADSTKKEVADKKSSKRETTPRERVKGLVEKVVSASAAETMDYSKVSDDTKMGQATAKEIRTQMEKNLSEIAKEKGKQEPVSGSFESSHSHVIGANMRSELSRFTGYLSGDTVDRMHYAIHRFEHILGGSPDEFAGVKAKDLNAMAIDFVQKLVHQEVESNRQQFTDHGIRHLVGNMKSQEDILNVLSLGGEKVTARDRLMSMFVAVNHDIGYTVPLIRKGGMTAIKASKDHKKFSEKIVGEEEGKWDRGKIFSKKEYSRIKNIVLNHDSTDLSVKDNLLFATTVADNTSLFHRNKLPSMFRYVKGGDALLIKMGEVAAKWEGAKGSKKTSYEKSYKRTLSQLEGMIDSTPELSTNLRRDLKMGVKEISFLTPKFSLGVLAGDIEQIGNSPSSRIVVKIKHNALDSKLQSMFDMGQAQTKKLLKEYGYKEEEIGTLTEYRLGKDKSGKSLLTLRVL